MLLKSFDFLLQRKSARMEALSQKDEHYAKRKKEMEDIRKSSRKEKEKKVSKSECLFSIFDKYFHVALFVISCTHLCINVTVCYISS